MILADENIDHGIIAALRAAGYPVDSIYEAHCSSSSSSSDAAIIELSRNPPRIILTEDKDFGEWVFAHDIRDISVIFLRYHFRDTAALLATLLELLRTRLPDLQGPFTTVAVQKIRIRPL